MKNDLDPYPLPTLLSISLPPLSLFYLSGLMTGWWSDDAGVLCELFALHRPGCRTLCDCRLLRDSVTAHLPSWPYLQLGSREGGGGRGGGTGPIRERDRWLQRNGQGYSMPSIHLQWNPNPNWCLHKISKMKEQIEPWACMEILKLGFNWERGGANPLQHKDCFLFCTATTLHLYCTHHDQPSLAYLI